MADQNIRFKWLADSRAAQQQMAAMEKRMRKMEAAGKAVNRTTRKGKQHFTEMTGAMLKSTIGVTALAAGVLTAARHMKSLRLESEGVAINLEKQIKRFQIQAGLNDLQTDAAKKRFGEIATKTGVAQEQVARVATEAASVGFRGITDKGGVAEAIIATFQSANVDLAEADVEGLVGAFGKMLEAGGKKLTAENFLDLAQRSRGLFGSTPLQFADLPDFAKAKTVATAAGISDVDFLSAATVGRQKTNAAEASTGLKNVILRLGGQSAKESKLLEGIGLDPKDVDLVGETFPQALKTLGEAIDRLPDDKRLPFLREFFGQKVAVQALNQIRGAQAGKFEKFAKLQSDREGFLKGVRVARSGVSAGIAKVDEEIKTEHQASIAKGELTQTEIDKDLELRRVKDRKTRKGFFTKFIGGFGEFVEDTARFFSNSEEAPEVKKAILKKREGDSSDVAEMFNKLDQNQKNAAADQKKLLQKIADNTGDARKRNPNRNAHGEGGR